MPRYVAFLRAVNVGGRVVKMERLRQLVAPRGYDDVCTFIASGNLLFGAPARVAASAERRIEAALREALGYEVETFVRPLAELAAIVAASPFGDADERGAMPDGGGLQVGFLKAAPDAATLDALAALDTPVDTVRAVGRELYWRCTARLNETQLTSARLARLVGPTTFRNVTSVRKLAAMAGDPATPRPRARPGRSAR